MQTEAKLLPLHQLCAPEKMKRPIARDFLETASHTLSGITNLPAAATQVGKTVGAVETGVTTVATKAAGVAAGWGWKGFAAFFLKVAVAALIAKIVVTVGVIAVAVCIFQVVRSA